MNIFFDRNRYPEEAACLDSLAVSGRVAVIGVDLSSPAEGLVALIAARRAGRATAVLPILPEPLEQTLAMIGTTLATTKDPDQRAQQTAALRTGHLQINGRQPHELTPYNQAHVNAAALALRLADTILLGAPGERDRWNALINRAFRRFTLLPVPEQPLAELEPGVTLYAPHTDDNALAHYALVLHDHGIDAKVVSARNPHERVTTRVVIAPEWRPLPARFLAARGHHVVTPNGMRIDECDSRIFGYAPADYRSIVAALDAARTAPTGAPRVSVGVSEAIAAIEREAVSVADGPRVSIIIRTFDRPALLRRAIESVAQQTYANVEIVVVNNGGADVSEIVREASGGLPFVYEVMPERQHISAASNVGARAATGAYIGYLDDDDLIYADHCARAVEALEQSRSDIVFTTCLAEYAEMTGDEKRVLGYQVYLDREFNLDDIYVSNLSPIHSIVHTRELFERFGYFDETLPVTDDWEFWLRAAVGGASFARVDRATCEYSWRYDPARGNMTIEHQWDFVHAYRKIVDRYLDGIANRPSIHAAQANLLAQQQKRAVDAADPAKRAGIVIGAMSASLVPLSDAALTEPVASLQPQG